MNRVEVIDRHLGGRGTYLEIGVRGGQTFWKVRAHTKIGVDPAFVGKKLNLVARARPIMRRTLLYSESSDRFFERRVKRTFDCVLVDGLHTAEQAYRDVVHSLDRLAPGGMIVMHDCNPPSETQALPSPDDARARPDWTGRWNGSVWQAVVQLRTRDDLNVKVLNCDQGLGIVTRGQPDTVLDLNERQVAALTYHDLAADRMHLLNLVEPQ